MKLQQALFKFYVLVTFFIGFISSYISFPLLNVLDDLVFLLLVLNLLMVANQKRLVFMPVFIFISSLLLLSSLFSILNDNPITAVLLSLRQYKNVFLCLVISSINRDSFEFVRKVLFVSLAVSVPLSIFQFITADRSSTVYFDEVVGVFGFGQSGTLSLLILLFVTSEFFIRKREGKRLLDWYLLLLLPCFINETKVVFVLFPILFLALLLIDGKKNKLAILSIIPMFVGGFLIANIAYETFFDKSIASVFTKDYVEGYLFMDVSGRHTEVDIGRFQRIAYAWEFLERKGWSSQTFGEGLGSSFYGIGSNVYGDAARHFLPLSLHTGSRIQVFHTLLDFGVFGTLLFFAFFSICWLLIAKSNTNCQIKYLALTTIIVVVFGFFYQNILTNRVVSFLVFYLIYFIFNYSRRLEVRDVS